MFWGFFLTGSRRDRGKVKVRKKKRKTQLRMLHPSRIATQHASYIERNRGGKRISTFRRKSSLCHQQEGLLCEPGNPYSNDCPPPPCPVEPLTATSATPSLYLVCVVCVLIFSPTHRRPYPVLLILQGYYYPTCLLPLRTCISNSHHRCLHHPPTPSSKHVHTRCCNNSVACITVKSRDPEEGMGQEGGVRTLVRRVPYHKVPRELEKEGKEKAPGALLNLDLRARFPSLQIAAQ